MESRDEMKLKPKATAWRVQPQFARLHSDLDLNIRGNTFIAAMKLSYIQARAVCEHP